MKTTVKVTDLIAAMSAAKLVTCKVLPVFECARFEVSPGVIQVISDDLTDRLIQLIPAEGEDTFAFQVEVSQMITALKGIKSGEIEVSQDGERVTFTTAARTFTVQSVEGDMPADREINFAVPAHFDGVHLREALRACLPYVGNNEFRPVLSGVFIQGNATGMQSCATDTKTLMLYTSPGYVHQDGDFSMTIEASTAGILIKVLDDGPATVYKGDNEYYSVTSGLVSLQSREIPGQYPEFEKVIPERSSTSVTIDPKEVGKAIASLPVDKGKKLVVFSLDGHFDISSQVDGARFNASIAGYEKSGDDLEIGFNKNIMLGFLKSFTGQIQIGMTAASRACVVRHGNLTGLIMPVIL